MQGVPNGVKKRKMNAPCLKEREINTGPDLGFPTKEKVEIFHLFPITVAGKY